MKGPVAVFAVAAMLGGGVFLRLKHNISNSGDTPSVSNHSKPDFETQVEPIFQARCQPCHFQGGQVYDKMPFDKAETITRLGAKLFTRIKDKNDRRVIQAFLDTSNSDSKNR